MDSSIKRVEHLVIFAALIICSLIFFFGAGFITEPGFYKIIPLNSAGLEMIIIILLIVGLSVLGGLIFGYVLGPLYLLIHKYTIGRGMVYVIQDKPEPKKLKLYFKSFFPALLSVHLAIYFGYKKEFINLCVLDTDGYFAPILTIILFIVITSFLSFSLFSPIWFLLDSGIVYSNRELVKFKRDPIEVRSIGGWYMNQLRGYAAIAVVLSYVSFFIEMLSWGGLGLMSTFTLVVLLFPFIITALGLPCVIILELTINHRKKFILKFAKKIGINRKVGDPLKEL